MRHQIKIESECGGIFLSQKILLEEIEESLLNADEIIQIMKQRNELNIKEQHEQEKKELRKYSSR